MGLQQLCDGVLTERVRVLDQIPSTEKKASGTVYSPGHTLKAGRRWGVWLSLPAGPAGVMCIPTVCQALD